MPEDYLDFDVNEYYKKFVEVMIRVKFDLINLKRHSRDIDTKENKKWRE